MNLRVASSARTAHSLLFLPLPPHAARRFDVCRVDHLHVRRSPAPRQLPEKILPEPATRLAHEAVVDRRRRVILGRAIAPAATTLENTHDPADDATIINPLDAANIGRQVRLDPSPPLSLNQNKFWRMIPILFQNESGP